ncbi:PREDICTED: uncharacterized protein LOC105361862 [Ceratosolen solmsi marchali]|uniref:Uncharacterized protein LOC105361862 n=1 Tax=Ceratosolen solmsi marchali TaxID=326594 RepID=A0AAJ7DV26_9HYME|nr:PREDICTED: uncharacterized protein LOC105361862 [Ceratosolen solmsi marchali]
MTLLLRTLVSLAILVVSIIATPPASYVKQADNDKNTPSYRYKYAIEDRTGDGQGKTEAREGEHASGRYYVSSKRSLTDVKYTADEWGYHPFVQYGSSDNHSSSSTTFAIGERAVANLPNKNIAQRTSDLLQPRDRIQLVRVVQPFQRTKQSIEGNDIFIVNSNETWMPDDSSERVLLSEMSLQPNSNPKRINSMNINYMTHKSQRKFSGEKLLSRKDTYLDKDRQLSTAQKQSSSTSSLGNHETSIASEEEQLAIDNVGSFGQKLNIQNNDMLISSTTASPLLTHSDIPLASTTIVQSEQYPNINGQQKNNKPYLPNLIPGLGAYSSTAFPIQDNNSVTANSIESDSGQSHESNIIDNEGWKSYSLISNTVTGSDFVTTRNPLITNYISQNIFSSILTANDTAGKSKGKKDHGFLKPIVVEDVPKERPFQYSTTFECNDVSSTHNPIIAEDDNSGDTTSSYILNPIQAGVALVNAGEAHLIVNDVIPKDKTLPAPVNGKIQEVSQYNQSATELVNSMNTRGNNDLGLRTPANDEENITQAKHAIEMEKSIEIKENSPESNARDSEKFTSFPETQRIKQQQLSLPIIKDLQQRHLYSTTNTAELNSRKIADSRTRSETLSKVYELMDTYPRDLSVEKPVYVIPPATYILEDSSVLKNSLLQEKVQQYPGDMADTKIKSDEQQIQIETHNGANQQHFRTLDGGVSYNSDAPREQLAVVAKNGGTNFEIASEKMPQPTHGNPFGKQVIEKKVPYHVEKIMEKKMPILHSYPIQVQVPIPQPIPIHIEKVAERKIPVSVHIPIQHPYSLDKQMHVPITVDKIVDKSANIPIVVEKMIENKVPVPQIYTTEIEKLLERNILHPIEISKYIEKPAAMQAPYGVQYGVSYQQIMKPQSHGLYPHKSNQLAPLYALSESSKNLLASHTNNITRTINDINVNNLNHTQSFQGYVYDKPEIPFNEGKDIIDKHQFPHNKIAPKIFTYNAYIPSYALTNSALHRRYTDPQRLNKHERNDYFGPVPPLHHVQRQFGFQSKAFSTYPLMADRAHNSRKSRNYEPIRYQKGNFRQSKIEYGFKPPMVPSVQYDEETASKVER